MPTLFSGIPAFHVCVCVCRVCKNVESEERKHIIMEAFFFFFPFLSLHPRQKCNSSAHATCVFRKKGFIRVKRAAAGVKHRVHLKAENGGCFSDRADDGGWNSAKWRSKSDRNEPNDEVAVKSEYLAAPRGLCKVGPKMFITPPFLSNRFISGVPIIPAPHS